MMNQQHRGNEMLQILDEADCLYSLSDLERVLQEMGDTLSQAMATLNPIVMPVMNGGLVFAGQLLPRLRFPLQLDYVHASRYQDKTLGGELAWKVSPTQSLAHRHILLLDDILDQGNTLLAIRDYCLNQGAASVKMAVLLDKSHERKAQKDLKADFTGLSVPDRFVFGFGIDYKGYWRNAPGIYAVKGL